MDLIPFILQLDHLIDFLLEFLSKIVVLKKHLMDLPQDRIDGLFAMKYFVSTCLDCDLVYSYLYVEGDYKGK